MFTRISDRFYRSVAVAHEAHVLDGSVSAGRYSRPDVPVLYLSATPEGVAAAMKAHDDGSVARMIVAVEVRAERIFDLRDDAACAEAGIDRTDALASWQDVLRDGGVPSSWQVADRLRALGANGLIDPSRTAPGLWHLVLFRWNVPGGAEVRRA